MQFSSCILNPSGKKVGIPLGIEYFQSPLSLLTAFFIHLHLQEFQKIAFVARFECSKKTHYALVFKAVK